MFPEALKEYEQPEGSSLLQYNFQIHPADHTSRSPDLPKNFQSEELQNPQSLLQLPPSHPGMSLHESNSHPPRRTGSLQPARKPPLFPEIQLLHFLYPGNESE